jgi:SAM-dependent methyltransferase
VYDAYSEIGYYYDAIVGDRAGAVVTLKKILKEHAPGAKRILEVACGTGSILKGLSSRYDVAGLDLSETMLMGAREKLPEAPLYHGDMRQFTTGEQYDAVLCMFDSINHLTTKSDWKKTFKSIRRHLEPGGLFIFDVNTPVKMEQLSKNPPIVHEFEGHTFILAVEKRGKHGYDWHSRIFAPVSEEYYSCIDETVSESAYSETDIRVLLKDYFKVLSAFDFEGSKKTKNTQRLCFICKAT